MIQPLKIKEQIIIQSEKKDPRDIDRSAQLYPYTQGIITVKIFF